MIDIATDDRIQYFISLWLATVAIAIITIFSGKNAAFKKKWWPRFTVFTASMLAGFIVLLIATSSEYAPVGNTIAILFPAIALLTYLNIKIIRFCGDCGKLVYPYGSLFWAPKFCPACGVKLSEHTEEVRNEGKLAAAETA